MRDQEPPVLAVRPAQPGLGQPLQVGPGGQAVLDRPVPERRFGQPLGPQPAPPRPVLRPAVTPRAARRRDVAEPRRASPGQQVPPGVRLAAQRPRHLPVQGLPRNQPGLGREPEHAPVVAVARGHHPARPAHPAHLGQRRHRIGQVLQHLMRVYHVERVVGERQLVHVPGLEPDVGQLAPGGLLPGPVQHVRRRVDPDDLTRRDQGGQVRGDRARAASHVEHPRVRRQVSQQVPGRVLRGAPPV